MFSRASMTSDGNGRLNIVPKLLEPYYVDAEFAQRHAGVFGYGSCCLFFVVLSTFPARLINICHSVASRILIRLRVSCMSWAARRQIRTRCRLLCRTNWGTGFSWKWIPHLDHLGLYPSPRWSLVPAGLRLRNHPHIRIWGLSLMEKVFHHFIAV